MSEIKVHTAARRLALPRWARRWLQALLSHALLFGVGLFFLVPFLWMLSTAFKSPQDVFRTPPSWVPRDNLRVMVNGQPLPLYDVTPKDQPTRTLALVSMGDGKGTFIDLADPGTTIEIRMRYARPILVPSLRWANFPEAMGRSDRPGIDVTMLTFVKNSLIVCLFAIIGTLASNAPVAYGFARLRWPGRDLIFLIVLGTMMLPYQVTMIPVFIMFTTWLHWSNTFLPLIVPAFFANAFDVFLLRQFFRTIPEELCDAARVDGASELLIFLRIVLPLSVPVLTTITVFTFLWAWNDFMGPLLFLSDPKKYTMALGLNDFRGRHGTDWHLLMAASTVFTLPIITAFFFAQRTFIQGVKLTGLKE